MGGPVALLLLIVSAFLVNAFLRSQGANRLITGVELLLVGLGLGPMLLDLLEDDELGVIRPAMHVAVCWLGLLFGLRASFREGAPKAGPRVIGSLLVECVATVAGVALLLRAFVPGLAVFHLPPPGIALDPAFAGLAILLTTGGVPLTLGLLAAPSTSALIEWARRALGARGPLTDSLWTLTSLDGWIPLLGMGALFAFFPAAGAAPTLAAAPLEALGVLVALALLFATVFALLCGRRPDHETAWVVLIGVVLVAAGVSGLLRLPGVVVAFLSGLGIAAFTRDRPFMRGVIDTTERPVILLLMLLSGLQLAAEPIAWLAAALVLALRTSARIVTGPLLTPLLGGRGELGVGLLGAGGVTLALAVQVELLRGGLLGQVVLWSTAGLLLFTDLVGPPLVARMFRRAKEVVAPPAAVLTENVGEVPAR